MINWFKSLFTQDKVETDAWGLPKVTCNIPMPEVKPCKLEKNISEPVHVIVKNMLEHPSRWKAVYTWTWRNSVGNTNYSVRDTRTGEVFTYHETQYSYGSADITTNLKWATKDEIEFLKKTLEEILSLKMQKVVRMREYKKNKERSRLLEIYK